MGRSGSAQYRQDFHTSGIRIAADGTCVAGPSLVATPLLAATEARAAGVFEECPHN